MRFHKPPTGYVALGTGETVGVAPSEGSGCPVDPGASAGLSRAFDAMSEREFQKMVVAGLEQRGWVVFHVPDSRRMRKGLPDLLCIHPSKPRLLAWELKSQRGRLRYGQDLVIAFLSRVPGVDARIVRPSDWSKLSEEL